MLKRIYQHFFLISTVLFAVLGFFFLNRLGGDSAKVSDMASLIVCVALFGCSAIACYLEDLERKLNKWLEPKTGGTTSGSVNSVEPCRQRAQREDLLQSLVHALTPQIVLGMTAADFGGFIRDAADAILSGGLPVAKSSCTCGPNEGCSNCPKPRIDEADRLAAAKSSLTASAKRVLAAWDSIGAAAGRVTVGCTEPHLCSFGAQADQRAEAEIVAKGLTAPRVTAEQIQALMAQLTWHYEQPKGTTSTFAHAYLGRFFLTTGHSACVSPENFDAALGMKYAREQAEDKAREKLWELEGYKLYAGMVLNK